MGKQEVIHDGSVVGWMLSWIKLIACIIMHVVNQTSIRHVHQCIQDGRSTSQSALRHRIVASIVALLAASELHLSGC